MRAALRGDPEGLARTAFRLSGLLEYKARMLVAGERGIGCDAEDLVQDMWVKVLPKIVGFEVRGGRATAALLGYMGKTLKNKFKDVAEAGGRERARAGRSIDDSDVGEPESPSAGPASVAEARDAGDSVRKALGFLGAADRELLVLRAVDRESFAELGVRYGLKPDTVRKRFERALDALKEALPPSILAELRAADAEDRAASADGLGAL